MNVKDNMELEILELTYKTPEKKISTDNKGPYFKHEMRGVTITATSGHTIVMHDNWQWQDRSEGVTYR